jgi:dihydroorotase
LVVGPGLVDIHVHFRDPGQTWKEDLETGSQAAAAGGFTAVVVMPNTIPAIDHPDLVKEITTRGGQLGVVELTVAGAVTAGRRGEQLADLGGMYREGVRLFSDDGDSVADEGLLRKAFTEIRGLSGATIAEHPEDKALSAGGHMHAGDVARLLEMDGLSASSEVAIVARDIELARETGGRLHLQHLSAAKSVDLVREAKQAGLAVTAEVTPHHLTLTEDDVAQLDTNYKMYPPLRARTDRATLVGALATGLIDVVATDHAPHTAEEKSQEFEAAPRGVVGLETALSIVLDALEGDFATLFHRMSVMPARIAGMPRQGHYVAADHPANLVVVDPESIFTVSDFKSRSANSPFLGRTLKGRAVITISEGLITHEGESR